MSRKILVSILLVLGLLLGQTAPALAAGYAAAPAMPGIEEPAEQQPAVTEEPSQAPTEQPAVSEEPPQPSESVAPTEQPPQPSESVNPSEQPPQPSESAAPTEQQPQPSESAAPVQPTLPAVKPQLPAYQPAAGEYLSHSGEPQEADEEQSMYVTNQMATAQMQTVTAMNPSGVVRIKISIGEYTTELPFSVDGNYSVNGIPLERQSYIVRLEGGTLNMYSGSACIASGPSIRLVQHAPTEGRNNFIVLHNTYQNADLNYLGDMEFKISSSYIRAINHVYMEDYLYGVVPSEMPNYFPIEALKAQAISARTYAETRMNTSGLYDLNDTSGNQVYKGFIANRKNSMQAVDQTAKTIVTYNGNLVTTYFSASNGGWTDLPYHRWNSGRDFPYFVIQEDPFDAANTASYYETIFFPSAFASYDEVTTSDNVSDTPNKLKAIEYIKQAIVNSGQLGAGITRDQFSLTGVIKLEAGPNYDFSCNDRGDIVEDHSRMPLGGVNNCKDFIDAKGTFTVLISATGAIATVTDVLLDLRYLDGSNSSTNNEFKAFNKADLILFLISPANIGGKAGFTISQKRFGHGVGLSQRGAQQMAKSAADGGGGKTYDQILSFYYPNTALVTQTYNRTELTPMDGLFTVTFDPQNGNGASGTAVLFGTAISPPAQPSRYCFNFTGWYVGGAPVSFPYIVTGNVTLTAGWARQPATNFLQNVALSSGSLNRGFSRAVTSYKITIGENDGSFTLTPIKEYDGAAMIINGKARPNYTVNLANGKSAKITVKVTYAKKSKTYTFTVTRAKSTNNFLGSLSVSAGALSQPFDPNVANYTLTLDENTKSTTIKASAAAGKAASVSPASSKITLNNGQSKTVKITVKAQSGARRTYTITVVRAASSNANLKSLKCAGLTPGFSPGNTNYTVVLPANKSSVAISAAAAGYKAVVRIDGGKASKKVTLANGQSVAVHIVVTSQAGSTKEYVVTVTRQ